MKISESDLALSIKNRVVRNFIITQTTSGKYQSPLTLLGEKNN
jgi:hypothetical protein